MKRLDVAAAARADLQDISRYTRQEWGADQARHYLDMLKRRLAQLRRRPRLGPPRDDLGSGYRCLLAGRHTIFYKDAGQRLLVVRILHVSMDVARHLPGPPRPKPEFSGGSRPAERGRRIVRRKR